ncbi:hypothetical protein WDU94_005700 [Cyamophila willieti]
MSKRAQFFKDYIKKQKEDPSSDPDEPSTPEYDSDNDPGWDPETEGNEKKLFFAKRDLQFDETQTTSVGPKPFNKVFRENYKSLMPSAVSNPENCPESIGKTYIELKLLNIQAEECLPSTSSLCTEPSMKSGNNSIDGVVSRAPVPQLGNANDSLSMDGVVTSTPVPPLENDSQSTDGASQGNDSLSMDGVVTSTPVPPLENDSQSTDGASQGNDSLSMDGVVTSTPVPPLENDSQSTDGASQGNDSLSMDGVVTSMPDPPLVNDSQSTDGASQGNDSFSSGGTGVLVTTPSIESESFP